MYIKKIKEKSCVNRTDPHSWLSENEETVLVLPFPTCVRRYTYPFKRAQLSPWFSSITEEITSAEYFGQQIRHTRFVELHEFFRLDANFLGCISEVSFELLGSRNAALGESLLNQFQRDFFPTIFRHKHLLKELC